MSQSVTAAAVSGIDGAGSADDQLVNQQLPQLDQDHAPDVTSVRTQLCGCTVAELRIDYPDVKLGDVCPIVGCGFMLKDHPRGIASTAIDAAASQSAALLSSLSIRSGSSSTSSSNLSSKLSQIVPVLPKWDRNSSCRQFLEQIDLLMPSSGIIEDAVHKWNQVLPRLMLGENNVSAAKWVQANIIEPKLDWEKSKELFTSHFQYAEHRETVKLEFRRCKQTKGESVQSYADRFTNLIAQLGFKADDPQTIDRFTDNLLPECLREFSKSVVVIKQSNSEFVINTLARVIDLCITIDVANRTADLQAGATRQASNSSNQSNKSSGPAGGSKSCIHHPGSTTHTTAECRKSGGQSTAAGSFKHQGGSFKQHGSNTNSKPAGNKSGCWTCGQPNHISPNCPMKQEKGTTAAAANGPSSSTGGSTAPPVNQWRTPLPGTGVRQSDRPSVPPNRLTFDQRGRMTDAKPGGPTVRGTDVHDPDGDIEEGQEETARSISVMPISTVDRTLPESVFAPSATRRNALFIVNSVPYEALLDSGASTSCMDASLINELEISIVPLKGKIALASGQMDRIGRTASIDITAVFPLTRVSVPTVKVAHQFEVLPLPDNVPYRFIMGMDLVERFFPSGAVPLELMPQASVMKRVEPPSAPMVRGLILADDESDRSIGELSGSGMIPVLEMPERSELSTPSALDQVYAVQRERIMNDPDIIAALEANSKVTGFCNLPESVAHLEVDPSKKQTLFRSQYKVAEAVKPKITECVERWFAKKVICLAPPGCPYNNPLLAVAKRDDNGQMTGTRVCLDVRGLNSALISGDKFQIPKIRDALETFAHNTIFGEFDLSEAYLQFELDEESRQYTAFTWNNVQYMFIGCPFGLSMLPSHFQRAMSFCLSDFPWTFAYLDNIPFGSKSWDEHRQHALCIINRLTQLNLLIKPSSVKFGHSQIKCLGHILSNRGVGIDTEKLNEVRDWPPPKTGEMLASFLGFAQYVRDHVRHFGDLTALLEAVKNDKEIVWTETLVDAFAMTKDAILRAPFLQFPDFSRPFHIATDASNTGIGGVLYQPREGDNDNITGHNIVAIHSKILTRSQRNYPAYKKELLALVSCLRRFHSYVWGRDDLVVHTDHKPLTFMFSTPELSPALQCWMDVIMDYAFRIEYRPGVMNVMPDALSRLHVAIYQSTWGVPSGVLTVDENGTMWVGAKPIVFPQPDVESAAADEVSSAAPPVLSSLILATVNPFDVLRGEEDASASFPNTASTASTAATPTPAPAALSSATATASGAREPNAKFDMIIEMEKRGKTVPSSDVEKLLLIQKEHDVGHFGREAVYKALFNRGYWWPSMRAQIQDELSNCDACTRYVVTKAGYNPAQFIEAVGPWDHIQIDCSTHMPPTPDGKRAMLVIIDVFTGFVILNPLITTSANEVAQHLWDAFTTFGFPKILQSDNGPEFVNDVLRAMVQLTGVEHRFISPYNPRADGKVERCIGTVTGILKKMLHGTDDMWSTLLPWAQFCFNNKVSSLTSSTPMSLMFGRKMNDVKDHTTDPPTTISLDDWKKHQEKMIAVIYPAISDRTRTSKQAMIKTLNKNRKTLLHNALPNGAIVMLVDQLRQNKFEPKYVGPYHIIRRARNGAYVLRDPATGDMLDRHVPVDQLKLISKKPRVIDIKNNQFEVQEILQHRGSPGKYEYYVKWKDYNDRTWEPASSFLDDTVIKNYWKHSAPAPARR